MRLIRPLLGVKFAQPVVALTRHRSGRQFPPNELYCFETWAAQVLDFIQEKVQAPAFLICNSVGGALPCLCRHAAGGLALLQRTYVRKRATSAGIAGLQAAVDGGAAAVAGVQLLNISLRMLHVRKQAPWQRPLVAALQRALRDTPLGTWFFASVAKPAVRLCCHPVPLLSCAACRFSCRSGRCRCMTASSRESLEQAAACASGSAWLATLFARLSTVSVPLQCITVLQTL